MLQALVVASSFAGPILCLLLSCANRFEVCKNKNHYLSHEYYASLRCLCFDVYLPEIKAENFFFFFVNRELVIMCNIYV